jgi:hypothetical protein
MPRILFLSPRQAGIIPPRRADGAFFLRVVGELGFQYIAVEALSSLSRFDAV